MQSPPDSQPTPNGQSIVPGCADARRTAGRCAAAAATSADGRILSLDSGVRHASDRQPDHDEPAATWAAIAASGCG